MLNSQPQAVLRVALVLTWLGTALTSLLEWNGLSAGLLRDGGLTDTSVIAAVVGLGVAVDVVFGVLLWMHPGRWVYRLALLQVIAMSLVATWLLPALWLHPLGPLLKNVPIVAMLWFLDRTEP
jgi:hypothetical protein